MCTQETLPGSSRPRPRRPDRRRARLLWSVAGARARRRLVVTGHDQSADDLRVGGGGQDARRHRARRHRQPVAWWSPRHHRSRPRLQRSRERSVVDRAVAGGYIRCRAGRGSGWRGRRVATSGGLGPRERLRWHPRPRPSRNGGAAYTVWRPISSMSADSHGCVEAERLYL